MARASVYTKLTLDEYARIIGIHPLHFNQVRLEGLPPLCDQLMFQYPWQTADHISREDIALAIAEAEDKIEAALGFHLAPCWDIDEWKQTARPWKSELVNLNGADIRGYTQTVTANWGYMISGGRQAKTLISASEAITYTDVDGDGYKEKASLSLATVAQDPNEIAIFYPSKDGEDEWEIRPTQVSIAAGTATIVFRREQAVIADKLDTYDIEGAEAIGTVDADFLTEVDVYRRYNDPQSQASFLWEPLAQNGCSSCNGSGCAACAYTAQTGCLTIRGDPRYSFAGFHPATWNEETLEFDNEPWGMNRQPDIVRLFYYSGWRNKSLRYTSRLDPSWARTVAHMASALLDRPPCDCVQPEWDKYRNDLTAISGDLDSRPLFRARAGPEDNPFGSRRGEVEAWQKVQRTRIMRSADL